jgi:2-octaprenylphenol hydroxylase
MKCIAPSKSIHAQVHQVLIELKTTGADLGQVANLRGFERWRKAEALTYIAAMEGLKRLFGGSHPMTKLLRGGGLLLADKITPAKEQIIKQAMGLVGELPLLAKPIIRK